MKLFLQKNDTIYKYSALSISRGHVYQRTLKHAIAHLLERDTYMVVHGEFSVCSMF